MSTSFSMQSKGTQDFLFSFIFDFDFLREMMDW
jgi:hypothetical protein